MTANPPAAMTNSQQPPWGGAASGQALGQNSLNPIKLWQIVRRRSLWFGVTFGLVFTTVGVVSLSQWILNPQYRGGFRLLVRDPFAEKQGQETSELAAVAQIDNTVNVPNLIEVLQSPMLLDPLAERLGLPKGSIRGGVSISRSRSDTDVLNVNLLWNNPKKGATLIEALSQEYLNYSQRQRREKLTQGLQFLDEQAPGLQKRVTQLQQELSTFRSANTMLAPEEQSRGLELSRANLASELRTLNQTEAQLQGLLAMVQSGSLVSPFQGTSTEISAGNTTEAANIQNSFSPLLQELIDVEGELAKAESSYRSDSPIVRNLRARRDRLRPLLRRREQDAIVSALQVNIVQQQKVQSQIDNLGDEFRRNPDLIKRYEAIQQRLQVSRDNLGSYIKARETFRLEVAQSTVPWQLISPAQFGVVPVEPNLQSRLMLGLLLGLVAGAGAAYARDLLDNVFHTKKEVEDIISLPILGIVPYLPLNPEEPIQESIKELEPEERFALRESLRGFYQSLRTLRANRTLRVVALTSSSAGEGKSTTCSLLGQTLVDMGMKVLLVDADLRRSRLHRRLGVDNVHGLSELFGENPPPLEELYQWIGPNLALLSGGPQLPDPARLLSSPRCAEIISQIRAEHQFDLILFDTPPALELVDPLLIAEHMDGLILLVSIGKVKRNLPAMVVQQCQSSEVDLLGVVTNSRVEKYSTYGGYGYGYGDRYGYGSNYATQAGKEENQLLSKATNAARSATSWLDGQKQQLDSIDSKDRALDSIDSKDRDKKVDP
jgi:capsular exopolysaccharide synthesis family protein